MNLTVQPSNTVRLVQFTDPHLFGDPAGRLRGIVTLDSLRATVAEVRARVGQWDATLLTGDLVQDDPAGYRHLYDVFGSLPQPVHCLPGNHDVPEAMRQALVDSPFSLSGHADYGPWRIVLLDSRLPGSADGELSASELARLDGLLGGAGFEHALVCLHHHPVVMGSRWLDQVGLRNAEALFAVLDRHSRARAVIWGHVHQEYAGQRGAVALYGTPSTCAQFRPRIDGFAIDSLPPGFRILELGADGSIASAVGWLPVAEPVLRAQSA